MTSPASTDDQIWDELRALREVPEAPPTALDAAREAVRRAAAHDVRRIRARWVTRRRLRVGLVAAATLAAVVVLLGGVPGGSGGGGAGEPAAAAVLRRAAAATLAQSDPVVGPGQYLRVRLVMQRWSGSYDDQGAVLRGRDGGPAVSQERETRVLWIPHDIDRDWIERRSTVTLHRGTTDPRYAYPEEPATVLRLPSWARGGTRDHRSEWDPSWFESLPRDPQQLLGALRAQSGAEGSGTAYDFSEVYSEVLRSGLAPAWARAAMFEGLAAWPDMQVTRGVETLDGRRGTAISAKGTTFAMVFDDETGRFIGERATDPAFPDAPGLDTDRTTYLTSVTTSVVDSAPRATATPPPEG